MAHPHGRLAAMSTHPAAGRTGTSPVVDAVASCLADGAELTLPQLVRAVKARAPRVSRGAVERALAADPRFADDGGGLHARWTLVEAPAPAPTAGPVDTARPLDGMGLRDWQVDAFAAWAAAGCRGVVEAVTGTGKTRLAIAAVRACLARDGRAVVLAPTLDLVDQWVRELRALVPDASIGRLGGGHDDDLHDRHVVVATPNSAATVPLEPPPGCIGLLVADEAHRYGAPTWAVALRPAFAMRLALTATYERNDDGVEDVLGPYFGGVVFGYDFAAAARDGVIAPFRVAFAGTDLEPHERQQYDANDRRAKELFGALGSTPGWPRDPRRAVQKASEVIARADGGGPGVNRQQVALARQWLAAIRGRRDAAAQCAGKLDVVGTVSPALLGRRSLVFTDTVEQAEQAARLLAKTGLRAEEVHGDLPGDKRRIRLRQFAKGNLDVVTAPRVLDEGVDVPDADVAVVLAAFRTRRQMVQRLGRVLRLKDDGREAVLVIAYAKDTREDPTAGAHRDFLAEVVDVAREVVTIDVDADPAALRRFVRPDATGTAPPASD